MINHIIQKINCTCIYNENTIRTIYEMINAVKSFTPDEFLQIYNSVPSTMIKICECMVGKIDGITTDCMIKMLLHVRDNDKIFVAKSCINEIDQINADQVAAVIEKTDFRIQPTMVTILATKMKNITVDDIIKISSIITENCSECTRSRALKILLKYVGEITPDQVTQILKLSEHGEIIEILSKHVKTVSIDDIVNFTTVIDGWFTQSVIAELFYKKLDTPTDPNCNFNEHVIKIVSTMHNDNEKIKIINTFSNKLAGTLQFMKQLLKYFDNDYKILLCKLFQIADLDAISLMDSDSSVGCYNHVVINSVDDLCKIINNVNSIHLKNIVKYFTMKKQDWINLIHNCRNTTNSRILINCLVKSVRSKIRSVDEVCEILAMLNNNREKLYFIEQLYKKIKIDTFTSVSKFIPHFEINDVTDEAFILKTALLFKKDLSVDDINKIVSMVTDKTSIDRLKNIFTLDRVFFVNSSNYEVTPLNGFSDEKFFILEDDTYFLVNRTIFVTSHSPYDRRDYNSRELFTIPTIDDSVSTSTDKTDKCLICSNNSKKIVGECGHHYCKKCLMDSFNYYKNQCPVCKCKMQFRVIFFDTTNC